jgi:diaminopimelate epimerase
MTAFFKVSGSGNDFVALAEPAVDPAPERIRAWCRRGISLGADGVFALRRGPGAAEVSMAYFNADGHPAELCLNGTRCAAQLAFHLGWADIGAVAVRTAAGTFRARRLDPRRVALELDAGAGMPAPRELTLDVDGTARQGFAVPVGVPHFLLLWPGDLDDAPVVEVGRQLRHHPVFQPAGTNVSFVHLEGRERLAIRTYERGVEDETLACGTGVVAAARLGLALGRLACPITALTRGGFELTVDRDAATQRFTLAGDARVVAAGELLEGAEA